MKRGFTLIEVIITMTIVSILAGMMVPAVWKMWEDQEVQTTRDRMTAIKHALVGDRNLMQNGVRTHYGYVGDQGYLPIQDQISSVKRYLPAGFDATSYLQDAWGNPISYTLAPEAGISARLSSDGINDSKITLDISEREVTPTFILTGTLNVNKNIVSARITSTVSGWVETCIDMATPYTANKDYPILSSSPVTLPIGAYKIFWTYYDGPGCTGTPTPQDPAKQKSIYILDGITSLDYKISIE